MIGYCLLIMTIIYFYQLEIWRQFFFDAKTEGKIIGTQHEYGWSLAGKKKYFTIEYVVNGITYVFTSGDNK